jgi:endonuclease/exonuclease/phosphatase family metal-dependent hydrolase
MNLLPAQDSLKIMTFNLQGMKPGSDPQARLHHIIQNIKTLDPDIIGLQEINEELNGMNNQGQAITDSLSAFFNTAYYFYQSFTHLSWNNQFREYIGIISKYPIEQQGVKQLPAGAFPRKVVWSHINTPLGKINFFNTHLSFNSEPVRIQQVQQTIAYVERQELNFPGIASILTGDFNSIPDSQPISLLTKTRGDLFIDTFYKINSAETGYTVPAQQPDSRIDFIFLKKSSNLKIDSSLVVMNHPYVKNNFYSDHYGVMTILKLNMSGNDK